MIREMKGKVVVGSREEGRRRKVKEWGYWARDEVGVQ